MVLWQVEISDKDDCFEYILPPAPSSGFEYIFDIVSGRHLVQSN